MVQAVMKDEPSVFEELATALGTRHSPSTSNDDGSRHDAVVEVELGQVPQYSLLGQGLVEHRRTERAVTLRLRRVVAFRC